MASIEFTPEEEAEYEVKILAALEVHRAKRKQYKLAYKAKHPEKYLEQKRRTKENARVRRTHQISIINPAVIDVPPAVLEQRRELALMTQALRLVEKKLRHRDYMREYDAKKRAARIATASA